MAGSQFSYTGNEVEVYLNGIRADLLQNISGSDSYGQQGVSGVGDIKQKEYVPSVANHSISIDKMVLQRERFISSVIIPENGDAALAQEPFDIEIFSKSGQLLRKWSGCVCESARVSVAAHRIVVSDASFVAVDAHGSLASK